MIPIKASQQPTKRSFPFSSKSSHVRLRQPSSSNLRARGHSDSSQNESPISLDSSPQKDAKNSFLKFMKKKASRSNFHRDNSEYFPIDAPPCFLTIKREGVDHYGMMSSPSVSGLSGSSGFFTSPSHYPSTTSLGSMTITSNRTLDGSSGFFTSISHYPSTTSLSTMTINTNRTLGGSSSLIPSASWDPSASPIDSASAASKRFRKASRNKTIPAQDSPLRLDTNLSDMSGIVDSSRMGLSPADINLSSSWDHPGPSALSNFPVSSSLSSAGSPSRVGQATFATTNPFRSKSPQRDDDGRFPPPPALALSPISLPNATHDSHAHPQAQNNPAASPGQSWTAPESWATIPRDGFVERDGSSDGEDYGREIEEPTRPPSPTAASLRAARAEALHRPPSLRKTREKSLPEPPPLSPGTIDPRRSHNTSIRVYRVDGKYHVVNCPAKTSVADMRNALTKRLGVRGETHRLYLREKGRGKMGCLIEDGTVCLYVSLECALGSREEPALILRRRMEQAGYSPSDDIDALGGEDLGFLLRFIFRSASLGGGSEVSEML